METHPVCPLTGHKEFDELMSRLAQAGDTSEQENLLAEIWQKFGTSGVVLISDMAGFSSTSRRHGVCHYLKLIYRTRQIVSPIIREHNGLLIKCDADNCYAFFKHTDDAVRASFAANAAIFEANEQADTNEQVYLSIGIDSGELLLIGEHEFFGDPVNTASKLGEDLAVKAETLVTERALAEATFEVPERAEHMVARISDIEIRYVRLPMTELVFGTTS
ncbi:MAG: adenylate/guanylate cyclase domain-containing protein [Woeseiaceae bacterium]